MLQRLLFRNVGDVYLLTHDAAAPDGVRYVQPAEVEEVLAAAPPAATSGAPFPGPQLVRQAQQMLEHAHRSYTHDLHVAARLRRRREQRAAAELSGGASDGGGLVEGRALGAANGGKSRSEVGLAVEEKFHKV